MSSRLKGLIIILIGYSAVFFCSCKKNCGIYYVPEILADEQFSGIGFAQGFVPLKGELVFTISSQSTGTVKLTVRGRGEVESDIVVNEDHNIIVFNDSKKWQEVTTSVHLNAGKNTIIIRQTNNSASPLMVDYIEFQEK